MDCIENADALILVTDWSEFKAPDLTRWSRKMNEAKIFDARNIYVRTILEEKGFFTKGLDES